MTFHSRRTKSASGSQGSNPYGHKLLPRVAISFDRQTFDLLSAEAERRQLPFAVIVREKIAQAYGMARDYAPHPSPAATGEAL